jgi:probable HAF family extracellular repeat protein
MEGIVVAWPWVIGCLFITSAASAATHYRLDDLGLAGRYGSVANAINGFGDVAGEAYAVDGSTTHGYIYSRGSLVDIGALATGDFDHSAALGLNDLGQAVGYSFPPPSSGSSTTHAVKYDHGTLTDLGALSGADGSSFAYDINNQGVTVGRSTAANLDHAVMFANGAITDLGTLGGGYSTAYAIADNSEIVGQSSTADGLLRAFAYRNGVMSSIGLEGLNSGALAVNEGGGIAGFTSVLNGPQQGFLYENGKLTLIGALVSGGSSGALGLNGLGQAVGFSDVGSVFSHAVLFDHGVLVDLNTLIDPRLDWELTGATAINDRGQIVGSGIFAGNTNQAFLLTPLSAVPDPATWTLLAGGLAVTGTMMRRRRPAGGSMSDRCRALPRG